jgi:hypothetical protein
MQGPRPCGGGKSRCKLFEVTQIPAPLGPLTTNSMTAEDFFMRKMVANQKAIEHDVETLEPRQIEVSVFDFKKDWALVEPHLSDPEVLELLNEGMLDFSKDHGWKHLPLWDPANDIGPWEYALGDSHATYASNRLNDDPEFKASDEKYERICSDEGFEFEGVFYEGDDPKKKQIFKVYNEDFRKIERKYLPQKNTYRWYQCFQAADYLKIWQLALAYKVFPEFQWLVLEKDDPETGKCSLTHIGKGPDGKYLIFDIFLFDSYSADEILEVVGIDRGNLEEEWEATKRYYFEE